jgi:hypothetical protein
MAGSAAPSPVRRPPEVRFCPRPAFSHLIIGWPIRGTVAADVGAADLLLDSASYCAQWMLLPQPQKLACQAAPLPTHDFGFGLCLVTAWAEQDCLTRAEPLDAGNCVTSQLLKPFLGILMI